MMQREPEAQLEFFDWGIRLQRTLFKRLGLCDYYELRYEELAGARLTGKMIRRGIRFHANFLPQPVTFVTVDYREILDRLERQGVPVDRDPAPLGRPRLVVSRRFALIWIRLVGPFVLLLCAPIIPWIIGAQRNFQTLQSDLAKVHLQSGYRLTAEHKTGTNCHNGCSLTQTWTWAPISGRTRSAACHDAYHAITSVFSGVDYNSPLPASTACDYYTIVWSLFHPGQGKREVDAIVKTRQPQANGGIVIQLVATYY